MKTTTQKNYKTFFENTIIDNIDFEGYGLSNDMYLYDKIKTVYNIFKSEYIHGYNKDRSHIVLFKEWLQGLPSVLTVPFYNYDILQNAEKSGYKFKNEEEEEKFLNSYWMKLSEAFFRLKFNL